MIDIPGGTPHVPIPPGGVTISLSFIEMLWNWITRKKPESLDTPIANLDNQLQQMAEQQNSQAPQLVLDLIRLREGCKYVSYLDSLGKLTGGVGHLIVGDDATTYPAKLLENGECEGTPIPPDTVDEWEQSDTLSAYEAAQAQAAQINISEPGNTTLTNALISVCFQLGNAWNDKFPSCWHNLLQHNWSGAIKQVQGTPWQKQTPVRVADFVAALQSLGTQPSPYSA
jgi:GH24 family phage-related lysozyme (muramidase)